MNIVPTLTTYADILEARISGTIPKFGYALSDSERASQNATFQTRLTQNINTYIIGQYNSTPVTPLAAQSLILSDSTGSNTNGYYYFTSINGGTVNISTGNNTLTTPKVVYVVGANVQINSDIQTSGNGSVVIIVQKWRTSGGNYGGDIYVDPDV